MNQPDPLDAWKESDTDRMIQTAELKAQEAEKYQGIGKAAYEAYRKNTGFACFEWSQIDEHFQCAWVEAAKAAVRADKENSK